ncbi:MAG: flippase-like domain-containing protein, partial [Candidatus Obscuribacterales bacterium]|nr:flippase-like domain-containing protein [Candidatus Obscuribacterales bacterium]
MTMETNKQTSTNSDSDSSSELEVKKESAGKQIVKQVIGIVLAGGMLYWCFKDADLAKLWHYAQDADPKFLCLVTVSALLSHLLRAWRWIILLKPLSDKPISLWNSFCAVMYGYAVNIVIPRGGEVSRLVAISKSESIPWAGVVPTMFIDRLLDLAMLVLLIGLTITVLPSGNLNLPWVLPTGITLCAATFVGLFSLPFVGKIGRAFLEFAPVKKAVPAKIAEKIEKLLQQFDLGTRSLTQVGNLVVIALFSVSIWACYYMNMYLMLCAFHLDKVVDLAKGLVCFTISSVGVLVPTPGSAG